MNEPITGSPIADGHWKIKQNKMLNTVSEPIFKISSKICPHAPVLLLVCIGRYPVRNCSVHFQVIACDLMSPQAASDAAQFFLVRILCKGHTQVLVRSCKKMIAFLLLE